MKYLRFILLLLFMSVSCFATETIKISSLTDGSSSVTTGTWLVGTIVDTTYKFSASSLVGLYLGTLTNDKYCKYNSATSKIDCIYSSVNLDDYAASGDLASYMPLSTFTAAGDVPVGSGSGAVTKISSGASSISTDPGANNTFFGVNNAGTLGFHASFNPVLVSAPSSDDTYSGTVASFTAGEALAQWDVVYCKNKSGVHACYKYDANGADKALPPRAMAVAAIDADASGTFLLTGIVRNDGWTHSTGEEAIENMSTDSAEGKIVYADGATAGRMTLTKSTTSADMVAILGYVIEQNVVYFNPSPILVEVP